MVKRHNTTSELVEGVQLRHLLASSTKRVSWCDSCTRAMYQFLATERLCPRNCGKDITALAATMDCTYPGFEEAVWPKIKASLRRKLHDLHREGNIVIYTDRDGVEQAHWPVETDRWRRSDWNGRRDNVVADYIRQRLEVHGSLAATDNNRQQRAAPHYVFERGSGRRDGVGPQAPDAPPPPPPPPPPPRDAAVDEMSRRRPSALSDDGANRPADLSDDDVHEPGARRGNYRPPSVRTVSEASSSSRRSRWGGGRGRRYAPWNIPTEISAFSSRIDSLRVRDSARERAARRGRRY